MPGRKRDAYDERFVNFRRNILQIEKTKQKAPIQAYQMNEGSLKQFLANKIKLFMAFLEEKYKITNIDSFIDPSIAIEGYQIIGYCNPQSKEHENLWNNIIQRYLDAYGLSQLSVVGAMDVLQFVLLFPFRSNKNYVSVQKFFEDKKVFAQEVKDYDLYSQIPELNAYNIYFKQRKQVEEQEEENEQIQDELLDLTFQPEIDPQSNEHCKKMIEKMITKLNEYGIYCDYPQNAVERYDLYEKYYKAKKHVDRVEIENDELEQTTFQPKVQPIKKGLFDNVERTQKERVQYSYLKEQQQKELMQCTFKPNITEFGDKQKQIYQKQAQKPRGYDKFVNRMQKGYNERMEQQRKLDEMGKVNYTTMIKPLSKQTLDATKRLIQERHIQRKVPYITVQIPVRNRVTTVKFYVGDTIDQHLKGLTKTFRLTFDEQCKVRDQLEKKLGHLQTDSIIDKYNTNKVQQTGSFYDPMFDTENNNFDVSAFPQEQKQEQNEQQDIIVNETLNETIKTQGYSTLQLTQDEMQEDQFYM